MRLMPLLCCVLAFSLVGLSCSSEPPLTISFDDAISIAAATTEDGVVIENTGDVDCILFVRSPEGEQQFELDVGESVTVADVTEPVEVVVVRG
jgi:hypothetical protein